MPQEGKRGCSVAGCCRAHHSRGLCRSHSRRAARGYSLDLPLKGDGAMCSVVGCGALSKNRGMCACHALRRKKGKDLLAPKQSRVYGAVCCLVSGCPRPVRSRGMCAGHLARKRKGTPLTDPLRPKRGQPCSVSGCDRESLCKGVCGKHYAYKHKAESVARTSANERGLYYPGGLDFRCQLLSDRRLLWAAPRGDFSGSQLVGSHLEGDFRRATFSAVDGRGCVFVGVFCDADFVAADLTDADFSGADLRDCVFSACTFKNTKFPGNPQRISCIKLISCTGAPCIPKP